jgi:hypothetical protein
MRTILMVVAVTALVSCGPDPKPASSAPASKPEVPKPSDESRRFPKTNLVETKVIDRELMGKSFMPGGTLAHYKKGKQEYDLFVARVADANAAALLLPDWRKALTDAKLIPSFGGYFGTDAGRPVFVFSKGGVSHGSGGAGGWIAGVAGLSEKAADAEARVLAAHLD